MTSSNSEQSCQLLCLFHGDKTHLKEHRVLYGFALSSQNCIESTSSPRWSLTSISQYAVLVKRVPHQPRGILNPVPDLGSVKANSFFDDYCLIAVLMERITHQPRVNLTPVPDLGSSGSSLATTLDRRASADWQQQSHTGWDAAEADMAAIRQRINQKLQVQD